MSYIYSNFDSPQVEESNKHIYCSQVVFQTHHCHTVGNHPQYTIELFSCFTVQWVQSWIFVGQKRLQTTKTIIFKPMHACKDKTYLVWFTQCTGSVVIKSCWNLLGSRFNPNSLRRQLAS